QRKPGRSRSLRATSGRWSRWRAMMADGSSKRLNLLIVDDSALMRALLRRAASLSRVPLGAIYEAGNGEEALRLLETASIDAVFTDLNMPVMTGFELLEVMSGD